MKKILCLLTILCLAFTITSCAGNSDIVGNGGGKMTEIAPETGGVNGIQTSATEEADVIRNDESGIPDRTLYQAILTAVESETGNFSWGTGTFTRQEAQRVRRIGFSLVARCDDEAPESLKGIEILRNLETIEPLPTNRLRSTSELKRLENLPRLRRLSLGRVSCTVLGESGETGLYDPPAECEDCKDNQVLYDLTPLRNLRNLRVLVVNLHRSLRSLDGVQSLADLRELVIIHSVVDSLADVEGLANLRRLRRLRLEHGRLISLDGVEALTNLEALGLSFNRLNNIEAVQHLRNLEWLNVSRNYLESIPNLTRMNLLTGFVAFGSDFSNNRLTEEELRNNLPEHLINRPGGEEWLQRQIESQDLD